MVDQLLSDFAADLGSGRLVLFTGAGFSSDARDCAGRRLPTTNELRDLLWPIVFGDAEPDGSELADLYECALRTAPEETAAALGERLHVDPSTLPDVYRTWFSMPWTRIYTLNVDDLDVAASRRFDLPVPIRSVSALCDGLPSRSEELLSIHLNGTIDGFPDITFSHQQYGRRTAVPDPWYQHLALDLSRHAIVFVGTQLAEPPLWHQLALQLSVGDALANGSRPRSYLVTPHLPRARQKNLETLNVQWIRMRHEEFASQVLAHLDDAAAAGHAALALSR